MKKRTTIADVARIAGVSLMTVSRAINNKPGLSDDLRTKILAIADEIDYQPSQIARGLATRQTATVGLVVPDITNPFFAQIARGVEDAAYENGYSVFLINTAEDLKREAVALNSLWLQDIDGAILCSLRHPMKKVIEHIERFPGVVLLNRELPKPLPNVVTINVNDQRGAQEAVDHFIRQGRKQIACIAGPQNSISGRRRLEGYRQALKNANLPLDALLVEQCLPNTDCGMNAAATLLSRKPDIDAIFAFNDLVAIGAMQACQDAGKDVPKEVAIIGADDIPIATIIRPQLSTLRVSLSHIGRLSMRTLLDIFEGETSPASYLIEPELILRESS